MSVTITIANNSEYVKKNCPELIKFEEYPADEFYPAAKFEYLPFEMNMANGNFQTVFSALGLNTEYCGSMDGRKLQNAIRSFNPELAIRATNISKNIIEIGIDEDRITYYTESLLEIADEAIKREEMVCWG